MQSRVSKIFSEVGYILKEKFDGATEVNIRIEEDNKPVIVRREIQYKKQTATDLVC